MCHKHFFKRKKDSVTGNYFQGVKITILSIDVLLSPNNKNLMCYFWYNDNKRKNLRKDNACRIKLKWRK